MGEKTYINIYMYRAGISKGNQSFQNSIKNKKNVST